MAELSFFSFDDGGEGKKGEGAGKKLELSSKTLPYDTFHRMAFNKLAFLAKGIVQKPNYEKLWMQYVYPIEPEGKKYLASANGPCLHYTNLGMSGVYALDRMTDSYVCLREANPGGDSLVKSEAMAKIFPKKEACFESPPICCEDGGELLFTYTHKLSGGKIHFGFDQIRAFVRHWDGDGLVKVYAPVGSPIRPWRLEHWDRSGSVFYYGLLIAPRETRGVVHDAKNLYADREDSDKVPEMEDFSGVKDEDEEENGENGDPDMDMGNGEEDTADGIPLPF